MQIKIGDKIRELRRRDGRKQEDLANAIGVTCQAVSRWEANGGYPDMELLPAIANYFHISIDELFGYSKDREEKLRSILEKADSALNAQEDLTECVEMLRAAADEFPLEGMVLVKLGYALNMHGWKKYGARSYTTNDSDYAYEDTEYNSGNEYWQEEVKVFEKALTMEIPQADRDVVIPMLVHVYAKMGYRDKALELAKKQSPLSICREKLLFQATAAEEMDRYQGEAIIALMDELKNAIANSVSTKISVFTTPLAGKLMLDLIYLYESVFSDGRCGAEHYAIAKLYLEAAHYEYILFRHGSQREGWSERAFEYLKKTAEHIKALQSIGTEGEYQYTAPLVSKVSVPCREIVTPSTKFFSRAWIEDLPDELLERLRADPLFAEVFELS